MQAEELAALCARLCARHKSQDVLVMDLRGLTDIADFFVIASVPTRVQMKALLQAIEKETRARGVSRPAKEGVEVGRWVLLDFVECVVHLFQPEVREFYDLETLWGDALHVAWEESPESSVQSPES